MIKIVIIGNGNVGSHLLDAFLKADAIDVLQVNSRTLTNIPISDVTIIAVSDDAIKEVASQLSCRSGLIAHTSGTVSLDVISNARKGVFYPLQSFTKGSPINFKTLPFCLETTNELDANLLETLVKAIGEKVYQITSEQREKLHLAAVFVNNFTNHMYQIGNEICNKHSVPFEILHPLIEETAKKIHSLSPLEAQTGPAKRNDKDTIDNHLKNLNIQQQEIYRLLTKSIQKSL